MKKYPREWEAIDADKVTHRLRIPGGWLIRIGYGSSAAIHFISEPYEQDKWILEDEENTSQSVEDILLTIREFDRLANNLLEGARYFRENRDKIIPHEQ